MIKLKKASSSFTINQLIKEMNYYYYIIIILIVIPFNS